ncbi:MAG: hypothetical protein WB998_14005 [Solirubrobacteraceae bacterium]
MDEPSGGAATGSQPATGAEQPGEQELRAAYEAELNRIASADLILQTTVSLINIGGRRLGLTAPGAAPAESERDLDQVRDAIDGARALMPILERHMAAELGPMRDAIAQLQMAYAREVQTAPAAAPSQAPSTPRAPSPEAPSTQAPSPPPKDGPATPEGDAEKGPGPAQASGRLWVPGQ